MKKLFASAVFLSLLLCACSGAPSARAPDGVTVFDTGISLASRAPHEPGATPYIRLPEVPPSAPSAEASSQKRYYSYGSADYPPVPEEYLNRSANVIDHSYSTYREFLESIYEFFGCFYLKSDQLAYFQNLPQTEPCRAVFHLETTLDMDERINELNQLIMDLNITSSYIYDSCSKGKPPEGYTYDFDRSAYLDIAASDGPLVQAFPLEYFEIREKEDRYIQELQSLESERRKQSAFLCAELLAEEGCDAVVRAMKSVDNGKETYDYLCVVTLTPEKLWELSGSMDQRFHVEQLYDTVDYRFDLVVWPEP